ncbi:MAG: hypothetical protein OEU32_03845 [Acidimicrobiia bacterium]|nr:hypothetical protein [Acidimicrobiia bacterium]
MVLTVCWSIKGGVGTTVVTALLAIRRAETDPAGVVAVDMAGDLPAALGISSGDAPGLADWVAADHDIGPDALDRLSREVRPGLSMLERGVGGLEPIDRLDVAAGLLATGSRHAIVDAGRIDCTDAEARRLIAGAADVSLLVIRPCYLALRRASAAPIRPSGVVLVSEIGRALDARDVEEVIGAPVLLEVGIDPAIARAVDAGLLTSRMPRGLSRLLDRTA